MKAMLFALLGIVTAITVLRAQSDVTVFEGGRVIIGDGRVIENASVVIDGSRIAMAL